MAGIALIKPDEAGRILAEAPDAVYLDVGRRKSSPRATEGRITVPGWKAAGLPVATGASGEGSSPGLKKRAGR